MTNSQKPFSFFFHDYETFGTHPAYDRPSQFAGIRTDSDFNIIGEPVEIYCKLADDYLPTPEAVLITGITPQSVQEKGLIEAEFARQIHREFSQPHTCILGYNNLRFDDEVTRNIFYRNFLDPYAYSWQYDNSRWDLLDLARACCALRPEGIEWPLNEQGNISFRLEHLTAANGLEHSHAHDAMSDVYATIGLAKLLKKAQPKLFDYFFTLRHKQKAGALIDVVNMTPLVHTSGMFPNKNIHTSVISPICWHPYNKNAVIVCDLTQDLSPLIDLDAQSIKTRLYTKHTELTNDERPIPIKLIQLNKCPILAPMSTLLPQTKERLALDENNYVKNWQLLKENTFIRDKLNIVFERNEDDNYQAKDLDGMLYDGFFSNQDRNLISIVQSKSPEQLIDLSLNFEDPRLNPLLFRYRARNWPQTLNEQEQQRWLDFRKQRFTDESVSIYVNHLYDLMDKNQDSTEKMQLLKKLLHYSQWLLS